MHCCSSLLTALVLAQAGQQAEESDDEGQETALLWGRTADNSPSPTAAAAAAESTAVKQVLVSTVSKRA